MSFQRETIDSFNSLLKKNKTLVFYVEIDQLWDDDYQVGIKSENIKPQTNLNLSV